MECAKIECYRLLRIGQIAKKLISNLKLSCFLLDWRLPVCTNHYALVFCTTHYTQCGLNARHMDASPQRQGGGKRKIEESDPFATHLGSDSDSVDLLNRTESELDAITSFHSQYLSQPDLSLRTNTVVNQPKVSEHIVTVLFVLHYSNRLLSSARFLFYTLHLTTALHHCLLPYQ